MDRFFQSLSLNKPGIVTYSKSAFTQARQKLSPNAFIHLREKQLAYFNAHAAEKRHWKGKRVIGIDGSFLILPNESGLIQEFGTFSNQKQAVSAGARVSIAYDVCNHLILDAAIGHTQNDDEKEMARAHLAKLDSRTDILVFDRGYPSLWLMAYLKKEGFDFCFRLSTAWKTAHHAVSGESEDIDWAAQKRPSQEYGKLKTYNLPTEVGGLRLVSIKLPNGESEVLLTSLSNRSEYSLLSLKELYHMRWHTEECYKRMKQVVQIEYFSGRTVHAVKQDFHARIMFLNMASMIESQSQIVRPEKKSFLRHLRQLNKTQVITKLKDFLIELFYGGDLALYLQKMLTQLKDCLDIIRPNRTFKRTWGYQYKRKALMYKGM